MLPNTSRRGARQLIALPVAFVWQDVGLFPVVARRSGLMEQVLADLCPRFLEPIARNWLARRQYQRTRPLPTISRPWSAGSIGILGRLSGISIHREVYLQTGVRSRCTQYIPMLESQVFAL